MTPVAHPSAYDVAVLGGGPAGAATALELARRGRSVVLLEATRFDGPRVGETLPPEANPLLRRLGVWDAFLASGPLESPGIVSVWGSPRPSETDFIANRHGPGWHVDRNAFDALLCAAAANAGTEVRTGTRAVRCTRAADGTWHITTSDATNHKVRARFVVDASGRNGVRLGPDDGRQIDDALVAVFLRFRHAGTVSTAGTVDATSIAGATYTARSADARTAVESVRDGWWYYAPLPSGESVAVLVVDPDFYVEQGVGLAEQLEHAPLICARVGQAELVASHVVHVSSSLRRRVAGPGWAAAGDAAAAYDPLSGFGIVKGLQNALTLADALGAGALDAYAADVRRQFAAYVAQRHAYYALETRWSEHAFWRERHARPASPTFSVPPVSRIGATGTSART